MRIILVHNFYRFRGGEDQVVENECALLREGGHQVETLFFNSKNIVGSSAKLRAAWKLPHDQDAALQLQSLASQFKPDLVHVHNFFPLATTAIHRAAKQLGLPVVQTLHNFRLTCLNGLLYRNGSSCELCVGKFPTAGIVHRCYQDSLFGSVAMARMNQCNKADWPKLVDRFIALSQFSKSIFVRAGIAEQLITVKPNFLDLASLEFKAPSLSVPKDYILYLGRMSDEKGAEWLTQKWAKEGFAPLLMVGDGPQLPQLREKYKANTNIQFTGPLPRAECLALLKNAKLVIVPSTCYENFPVVLLEALVLGTPVLASNQGSIQEILQNGEWGKLFSLQNEAEFWQKAEDLWRNPNLAFTSRAQSYAQKQYSSTSNLRHLEEIYGSVLSKAGSR